MTTIAVVYQFSALRVVSRTFGAFFANTPLVFLLSAAFIAAPVACLAWMQTSLPEAPVNLLLFSLGRIVVGAALGAPALAAITFAAMKRSATLTKGRRWEVFGLLLLAVLVMLLTQLAMAVVLARPGINFFVGMRAPSIKLIVGPLIALVATAIIAVGAACLYEELRLTADDVGLEQSEE